MQAIYRGGRPPTSHCQGISTSYKLGTIVLSHAYRQGTSYKYLMTGGVKGPLVVSYVMFAVESNELRGPFVACIFNEIISIIMR